MATVWLTGASSGIGRALALALATRGDTVVATARRTDELKSLATAVAGLPGRIRVEAGDVTDPRRMVEIVAAVEAETPIDIAMLNAGMFLGVSAQAFDAGAFQKSIDVNVMGVVNALAAILPPMMARRRGRIAIMASLAGYGGAPTSAAYGATKAALINLAAGLKFDLDRAGIVIQVINPGFIATPRNAAVTPRLPFLMPLDEAARRIIAGLATDRFEIAFPRRFALLLKGINLLPYRAYFALVKRLADGGPKRS